MPARFLRAVIVRRARAASVRGRPRGRPGASVQRSALHAARRSWSSTRTSAAARRASTRRRAWRAPASRPIVGESFSEIFQGNSAMLGFPASPPIAQSDRAAAVARSSRRRTSRSRPTSRPASSPPGRCDSPRALPPALRDAFVSGQWNPTAMLLDRFDEVRARRRHRLCLTSSGFSKLRLAVGRQSSSSEP